MTKREKCLDYGQQVAEKYGDSTEELSGIGTEKVLVIEEGSRFLTPYMVEVKGKSGQNGNRQIEARVIKSGATDLEEGEERTLPEDTRVIPIRAPRAVR